MQNRTKTAPNYTFLLATRSATAILSAAALFASVTVQADEWTMTRSVSNSHSAPQLPADKTDDTTQARDGENSSAEMPRKVTRTAATEWGGVPVQSRVGGMKPNAGAQNRVIWPDDAALPFPGTTTQNYGYYYPQPDGGFYPYPAPVAYPPGYYPYPYYPQPSSGPIGPRPDGPWINIYPLNNGPVYAPPQNYPCPHPAPAYPPYYNGPQAAWPYNPYGTTTTTIISNGGEGSITTQSTTSTRGGGFSLGNGGVTFNFGGRKTTSSSSTTVISR